MSDKTIDNNPWGIGFGLQSFLNSNSRLKLTLETTIDTYFEDDKVLRVYPNGTPINDVRTMINVFGGPSLHPSNNFYLSIVGGPSFIGNQTYLGTKPSIGFYFSKSQRLGGRVSYINIYNRDALSKEDFTSVSLALTFKLL